MGLIPQRDRDQIIINNHCCHLDGLSEKVDKILLLTENSNKLIDAIDKETTLIAEMIEKALTDIENNVITPDQLRSLVEPRLNRLKQIGNTNQIN